MSKGLVNNPLGNLSNTYPFPIQLNLAANGVQNISATGAYFYIATATGSFTVSIDGQTEIPMQAGLAIPAGKTFTNLTFRDTSGSQNVITGLGSTQEIRYYPPSQNVVSKDAPTILVATTYRIGSAAGQLPGNTTVSFSGLSLGGSPAGVGKVRRSIAVTNEDLANPIEVWDTDATAANAVGVSVYPQRTDIFFTSGVVKVRNPNGGAQNVTVLETFYL